jgi:N-acyl-D-aspartate/D-glutamate deacylase
MAALTILAAVVFDVVIRGGRVMDPQSGYDDIANVGIRGGRIVSITKDAIEGQKEIDATGLVVAPGFIDILSSTRADRATHEQKIADGVTTTMGMHGGALDAAEYSKRMAGVGPLLNFGAAVGDRTIRAAAGVKDPYKAATPAQIGTMRELADRAIASGAAGIGFGINYAPGESYEEVHALFETAAKHHVSCHLHARHKGNVFPETMSLAVMEVISMAASTGARAQLAHLTSSTVGSAPLSIRLIEGAARHGVDVGFDFHVWTRNETTLQSALYDEGWQERFGGISYEQIYVASTQERLTKARFDELRQQKKPVIVQTEFIREDEIEMAIRSPLGIISSDGGGLTDDNNHPRSVGTFARFLRIYVREKKLLPLMEGLRRITLMPAQRLELSVPQFAKKGRVHEGSDADLTIFDPAAIRERATYESPALRSEGVAFVVVNGVVVLDRGRIVEGVAPGRWLRHTCDSH